MAETLQKLSYQNLEQFVEDLNKNFGIIQNSPLYKGIPGKGGEPGVGIQGVRGSQFIFVELKKFTEQFPGQYVNGSQITLNEINLKMTNFEEKQKLLLALGVTEFVNNDCIVLTNSIILKYDIVTDLFVDTKIAFNEQSNLVSSIENKIEEYVQFYIENDPELKSKNIFNSYITKAKNYTDDSGGLTPNVTPSSVLTPYYPGVTTDSGPTIIDHKYFGYSNDEFSTNNSGTLVAGSIRKFIELLMTTTDVSNPETLSGEYAPTLSNIPALVVMQDTDKNGIMIGRKNATNIKRFGSIYKDSEDSLIIKSDQGINASDFSILKINRESLRFNKKAFFDDDLEIAQNTILNGNIFNAFIRTGGYASETNPHTIEVGVSNETSVFKNVSKDIFYSRYLNNVLVTGADGKISKEYSIEKTTKPINGAVFTGSNKKLATSDYIQWLYDLINTTGNSLANYWKKSEFAPATGNPLIPALRLSYGLAVGASASYIIDQNRNINANQGTFVGNLFKSGYNGSGINFKDNQTVGAHLSLNKFNGADSGYLYSNANASGYQMLLKEGGIDMNGDLNIWTGKKIKINNQQFGFSHLATGLIGDEQLPERLREIAKTLPPNTNMNTIKQTGFYFCTGTASAPASTGLFYYQVIQYTAAYFVQIAYRGTSAPETYIRSCSNNSWTQWYKFYGTHNLTKDVIENLLTGELTSHSHDTSKITSGQFVLDRMPRAASGFLRAKGTSLNPAYESLVASDIPNLDTSKITSGQFSLDRLPRAASGFLRGKGYNSNPSYESLVADDIPNLDASKITSGQLSVLRLPTGHTTDGSGINADLLDGQHGSAFFRINQVVDVNFIEIVHLSNQVNIWYYKIGNLVFITGNGKYKISQSHDASFWNLAYLTKSIFAPYADVVLSAYIADGSEPEPYPMRLTATGILQGGANSGYVNKWIYFSGTYFSNGI